MFFGFLWLSSCPFDFLIMFLCYKEFPFLWDEKGFTSFSPFTPTHTYTHEHPAPALFPPNLFSRLMRG